MWKYMLRQELMHYSAPQLAFAVIPAIMLLVVAARMFMKKLYRECPLFFAYSIYHVVSIGTTIAASRISEWTYFYTYWTFQLLDIFLTIAVVQEIYSYIFRPYSGFHALGRALFRWAAFMLLIGCVVAAAASPGNDSERVMAGLLVLSRSADMLIGGLLLLLFTICGVFAIPWKKYVFGFAVGLALLSSISLIVFAIRTHVGEVAHRFLSISVQLSYNIAAVIWVVSAFTEESQATSFGRSNSRQLREWNRALLELLNQ
jgi:hypothetical protein